MEKKSWLRTEIILAKKLVHNPTKLINRRKRLDAAKAQHRRSVVKGMSLTFIDLEEAGTIALAGKRPVVKLKSTKQSPDSVQTLKMSQSLSNLRNISLSRSLVNLCCRTPSLLIGEARKFSQSRLSDTTLISKDFSEKPELKSLINRNERSNSLEKISVFIKDCSKIKSKNKVLGSSISHSQLNTRLKEPRRRQILRDLIKKLQPKPKALSVPKKVADDKYSNVDYYLK
mmetsp:Transcript_31465/g.54557  ORF Transcript_31465/g.54557 Transcript_31465/m.54557 type:complete len:229 (+) Transcript_31465:6013-6699(+)